MRHGAPNTWLPLAIPDERLFNSPRTQIRLARLPLRDRDGGQKSSPSQTAWLFGYSGIFSQDNLNGIGCATFPWRLGTSCQRSPPLRSTGGTSADCRSNKSIRTELCWCKPHAWLQDSLPS